MSRNRSAEGSGGVRSAVRGDLQDLGGIEGSSHRLIIGTILSITCIIIGKF